MGCGCNKKKGVAVLPPSGDAVNPTVAARSGTPVMYEVFDGSGSLVASFSNPATARREARRVVGNVVPTTTATTSGGSPADNTTE